MYNLIQLLDYRLTGVSRLLGVKSRKRVIAKEKKLNNFHILY